MKNILILSLLFFVSFSLHAQFGEGSYEDVAKLKKTKTYVVLSENNEEFNKYLKKAVNDNWTLTEYEFISFNELEKYSGSAKNSFIVVSDFSGSTGTYSSKTHSAFYTEESVSLLVPATGRYAIYGTTALTVQLGGKKFNANQFSWIAFTYGGQGNGGFHCEKMDLHVKLLQKSLNTIETEKLKKLKWKETASLLDKKDPLDGKTLILWKYEIPQETHLGKTNKKFLDPKEIEKRFSGNYKIVSTEELEASLSEKNEDNLYFISFVEGTFSSIFLSDYQGNIVYYKTMGRMATESTFWWNAVLKSLEKAH